MGAQRDATGRQRALRTAGLAAELADELDALTDEVVEAIWHSDRTYVGGSVTREEVWGSCHANLARLVQTLAGTLDPAVDPYDAPRATGRQRAEQGLPLESVLHSYRVGGRVVWQSLMARDRAGSRDPDALLDAATAVWDVIDAFSTEVATAYRASETERVHRDARESHALVARLLLGGAADPTVAEQARLLLDLPATGGYVVVAVRADGEHWARSALAAHRLDSVWSSHDGQVVGLVPLRGRSAQAVVRALRSAPAGAAGLGVEDALARIDRAWADARLVLATLAPDAVGPVTLDERVPEALLSRSPDLAERLVDATLGPVLAQPDAEVQLATLRTWLTVDRSPSRTARALYCHRNTVLNRLHRVSAVTGIDVEDPAHHLRLDLALRALALRA